MAWHAARQQCATRQSGGATLVVLTFLVLLVSASLVGRAGISRHEPWQRATEDAEALARARSALIAWSSTGVSASAPVAPGRLPFPDRNRDGNYDGKGDCVTYGLKAAHLLGRLPWAGDDRPCPRVGLHVDIRDASGEPLWYAVSRNLLVRGGGGSVNPDMGQPGRMAYSWIAVRDANGEAVTDPHTSRPLPIAAVVIAPRRALADQNRSGSAPPPEAFLDRIDIGPATFDNADADGCADGFRAPCTGAASGEEFVRAAGTRVRAQFNDRLAYIAADDIVRAVEKRVLGEVASALNAYHARFGAYPWLARFRNPRGSDFKSDLSRHGLLAVHLPGEQFSTRFGGRWHIVDPTPTTAQWHTGAAALVPPLDDVLAGTIRVARASGRCRWREPQRAECVGRQRISGHYRSDLGRNVQRVVEYAFSVTDASPQVTAPTPSDVRRRTLVENPIASMSPASPGWSVRVTDEDGVHRASRTITIDSNTMGAVTLSGIRFDMSVVYDGRYDVRDELPEWLIENEWHRFVYVAYSADAVAGGDGDADGDCATPVDTCLTLNVDDRALRTDVRALIVSSGVPWSDQDRSIGDCDGDRLYDGFLCAYFEGDNADVSTHDAADTFARAAHGAGFNDQVRVVAP